MRVGLVTTGCVCGREGEREPAPAGDGGLREALEEICALGEKAAEGQRARGLRPTPPFVPVELVRDALAAHPAAHAVSTDTAESTASTSAVPLPVDREALTALVDGAEHYDTCFKMLTPVTNNVCTCLLADLRALLAGGGQS